MTIKIIAVLGVLGTCFFAYKYQSVSADFLENGGQSDAAMVARLEKIEADLKNVSQELCTTRSSHEGLKKKVIKLKQKNVELNNAINKNLSENENAEGDEDLDMTDEERQKKIAEIKSQIATLVQQKNGPALVKMIRELRKLGEAAFPEIVKITDLINDDLWNKGNQFQTKREDLWASFDNKIKLWALDKANLALTTTGFRLHSAYGILYGRDVENKDQVLANALLMETDKDTLSQYSKMLENRPDAETAATLMKYLQANANLEFDKYQSILNVVGAMPGDEVTSFLEQQMYEATDEESREYIKELIAYQKPAATGYRISDVYPETQASINGLQKGDIIVQYGEHSLSGVTLWDAMAKDNGESVPLKIYRNGELITVMVKPGTIGVNGKSVQKKDE